VTRLGRTLLLLAILSPGSACRRGVPAPVPEAPRDAGRRDTVELSAEGMANAGVEVAPLEPKRFSPHLKIAATIGGDPRTIAQVGAKVPGRVTAIRVKLGDAVRRGQALVEIDGAEVHQVTSNYLSAAARLRAADDVLSRQRQLVAERVGAVADLRRAEAEQAGAMASRNEASEHLRFLGFSAADVDAVGRSAGEAGHRGVVRAPIDGRVAAMSVTLGQVLTGSEPIITVAKLDRVVAVLRLYERDLAEVKLGKTVDVTVQAYPGRVFRGVIGFVGDLLDPATRTLEARADLANADGALKPGMTAVASVPVSTGDQGLWLPTEAVQPHRGSKVVFVAVGERRFTPRAVSVGEEMGGYVPIQSGVAPGTPVVVKGALTVRGELERATLEED
jgi:membrane fusion protein, heavy metal efflux system